MKAALSRNMNPPRPSGRDGPPPDLRAPAGPAPGAIALVDALERLRDGVEIFGPPLLVPDARGARGDGPVHVAALRGDLSALLALAAAGAALHEPGAEGLSPERLAIAAGRRNTAALLAARGGRAAGAPPARPGAEEEGARPAEAREAREAAKIITLRAVFAPRPAPEPGPDAAPPAGADAPRDSVES